MESTKSRTEPPLQVYITPEERRLLRVRAAQAGLSMSAYVRRMIQQTLGSSDEQ